MADPITSDAVALEKAHFINCIENTPSSTFYVQFNPKELKLDDRANYSPDSAEKSGDKKDFHGREGAKLSMELIFDTTIGSDGRAGSGANVNDVFVRPLRAFLALTPPEDGGSDTETQDGEDRPPTVQFRWGPFSFMGAVDSVNTSFLMFSAEGVPLRARVNVSMTTDRPEDQSTGNGVTDQTRLLPPMVRRLPIDIGNRSNLGSVAERFGISEQLLALANNIDDPLSLGNLPLDSLSIPSSAEMADRLAAAFRDVAPKSLGDISRDDVMAALQAAQDAGIPVDEARAVLTTAQREAQRLVGEANASIGEVNKAVDDLADELDVSVPDIPDLPDIPDFEPPF